MENKRYTMQRQIIFEAVNLLANHPTAEDVFMCINPKYPQISLSTVYRNLYALVQDGKIKKLSTISPERFDHNMEEHIHFRCDICQKIHDIDIDMKTVILDQLEIEPSVHKVDHVSVILNGICKECKDKI